MNVEQLKDIIEEVLRPYVIKHRYDIKPEQIYLSSRGIDEKCGEGKNEEENIKLMR